MALSAKGGLKIQSPSACESKLSLIVTTLMIFVCKHSVRNQDEVRTYSARTHILKVVKISEMGIFWCISITNNVKSCKQLKETAQTSNFTVFSMCGRESSLLKRPIFDENSGNKNAVFSMFSASVT